MNARALHRARSVTGTRGGLARRILLASGIIALLAIGAYALMFAVILDLRDTATVTNRSKAVLASVNRLERLVTDLETDISGFVITGDRRLLSALEDSQDDVFEEGRVLERLAAKTDPGQAARAHELVGTAQAYVRAYSVPLLTAIRNDSDPPESTTTIAEGERRLEPLRARFKGFMAVQRAIITSDEDRSAKDATGATLIAAAGAGGALSLLLLFSGYLNRAILRPVRRTAAMATALAGGDLSARIPEISRNEIGVLERAFNSMAASLQTDRQQLRRAVEEQAAVRRIATIIAYGVSPSEIFNAVATELGRIQGMEHTVVNRIDRAGIATSVGHWSAPAAPKILPPAGGHWPATATSAAGEVLRTHRPVRLDTARSEGAIGRWYRANGIHYVIGIPIMVSGRFWGMIAVFSADAEPPPEDTEDRVARFVGLVATAIANAENRNELLASTARIVAASDEARRRIERSLKTGPQRRLMLLGEKLRLAQAAIEADHEDLRQQLSRAAMDLESVLDDLREISRGLHPTTLSRSGLRQALEALTQRSEVPVDLTVQVDRHLPDHVQVAVYYTVSEALTNVAKHARATAVSVRLRLEHATLRLTVDDNGVGGADPSRGSGLSGLKDRIEALGGTIEVISPSGCGTRLAVGIPAPQAEGA